MEIHEESMASVLPERLLGNKELRELSGFNANTVSQILGSGLIPVLKIGTGRQIHKKVTASAWNQFLQETIDSGMTLSERIQSFKSGG